MERKIAVISIIAVTFIGCLFAAISEIQTLSAFDIIIIQAAWFSMGHLYAQVKTKYTFKVWLEIRKLNKQIKKLKKVAETNLKGKGRDKKFCNPVYTAREVVDVKEKELKELVR